MYFAAVLSPRQSAQLIMLWSKYSKFCINEIVVDYVTGATTSDHHKIMCISLRDDV